MCYNPTGQCNAPYKPYKEVCVKFVSSAITWFLARQACIQEGGLLYSDKDHDFDVEEIKNLLSIIESKFHGKSSGLDPSVSLFNSPIFYSNKQIKLIDKIPVI